MFVVLAALVAAAAAGTAHAQLFKAAGATFQQALMSDFEAAFEVSLARFDSASRSSSHLASRDHYST
jgi:hypothetical protein